MLKLAFHKIPKTFFFRDTSVTSDQSQAKPSQAVQPIRAFKLLTVLIASLTLSGDRGLEPMSSRDVKATHENSSGLETVTLFPLAGCYQDVTELLWSNYQNYKTQGI